MKKRTRNSAKAVIIRGSKLLVIRKKNNGNTYALLPGGRQKKGELLTAALRRECLEEINAKVKVGQLLFVREYLSAKHEFAYLKQHAHVVEFFFEVSVPKTYQPELGQLPDPTQFEVRWIDLKKLEEINFYPKALVPLLQVGFKESHPVYLGDIN